MLTEIIMFGKNFYIFIIMSAKDFAKSLIQSQRK